jgi:hypothetical protein
MTETATCERIAYLKAEVHKRRPDATETAIVPAWNPGAVVFVDGRYFDVTGNIAEAWPHAERWLQMMLDLWPVHWRLDYWRERIDRGAAIMTAFFDSQTMRCTGAGFINPEMGDDGGTYVFAPVMTVSDVNLSDLAHIAESFALRTEVDSVQLWTPTPQPLVEGYQLRGCVFGRLQAAPVRPIQ